MNSNLKKLQRAALVALTSLLALSAANATPLPTQPIGHNIKQKCYCARSSNNADRAYLDDPPVRFNAIDGQPIR